MLFLHCYICDKSLLVFFHVTIQKIVNNSNEIALSFHYNLTVCSEQIFQFKRAMWVLKIEKDQLNACDSAKKTYFLNHIIQIYSEITRGRILNGALYAHRLHKLIYLYLFTYHFMKIAFPSSQQFSPNDVREIFMKQSVYKYR